MTIIQTRSTWSKIMDPLHTQCVCVLHCSNLNTKWLPLVFHYLVHLPLYPLVPLYPLLTGSCIFPPVLCSGQKPVDLKRTANSRLRMKRGSLRVSPVHGQCTDFQPLLKSWLGGRTWERGILAEEDRRGGLMGRRGRAWRRRTGERESVVEEERGSLATGEERVNCLPLDQAGGYIEGSAYLWQEESPRPPGAQWQANWYMSLGLAPVTKSVRHWRDLLRWKMTEWYKIWFSMESCSKDQRGAVQTLERRLGCCYSTSNLDTVMDGWMSVN